MATKSTHKTKTKELAKSSWLGRFKRQLATPLAQWGIATVVFFGVSLFYMGSAITSCSVASPALVSDSTGGLAWEQYQSGNGLSWGRSNMTNYPFGESIARSQDVTSEAVYTPYRFFSWLTSPICGLNLMILLGYMSSALVMFGLVRWLFGRAEVAYFAGYASAFVPYHQLKSGSHIFYLYNATFAGIVWAFLWYLQRPSYRRVSLITLLAALTMYMDGYFILLTIVLVAALALVLLFSRTQKLTRNLPRLVKSEGQQIVKNLKTHGKFILWFIALFVLLLGPILFYQVEHGSDIKNSLSSGRGSIQTDAKAYGARPAEYLIPSYNNYFVPAAYTTWRLSHQHGSNPSENTLFIGYTVLVLAGSALVLAVKRRKLKLKENLTFYSLVMIAAVTALICLLFSLSPQANIGGYIIYGPTHFLIAVTAYWRVFARLFLVVDTLFIVLAAAALHAITLKWSKPGRLILVGLCTLLLFGEYLAKPVRSIGNLNRDSPATYQTIAHDPAADLIMEYPLQDLAYAPAIFTYQLVHQKALLNPHDSVLVRDAYFQAISGLGDPQTLGVLKTRGVNVVVTPGFPLGEIPGLEVYGAGGLDKGRTFYKIGTSVQARTALLAADSGFALAANDGYDVSHRALLKSGTLAVLAADQRSKVRGNYQISFDLAVKVDPGTVTIKQNGQILWQQLVDALPAHVDLIVSGESAIDISTTAPMDVVHMLATPAGS